MSHKQSNKSAKTTEEPIQIICCYASENSSTCCNLAPIHSNANKLGIPINCLNCCSTISNYRCTRCKQYYCNNCYANSKETSITHSRSNENISKNNDCRKHRNVNKSHHQSRSHSRNSVYSPSSSPTPSTSTSNSNSSSNHSHHRHHRHHRYHEHHSNSSHCSHHSHSHSRSKHRNHHKRSSYHGSSHSQKHRKNEKSSKDSNSKTKAKEITKKNTNNNKRRSSSSRSSNLNKDNISIEKEISSNVLVSNETNVFEIPPPKKRSKLNENSDKNLSNTNNNINININNENMSTGNASHENISNVMENENENKTENSNESENGNAIKLMMEYVNKIKETSIASHAQLQNVLQCVFEIQTKNIALRREKFELQVRCNGYQREISELENDNKQLQMRIKADEDFLASILNNASIPMISEENENDIRNDSVHGNANSNERERKEGAMAVDDDTIVNKEKDGGNAHISSVECVGILGSSKKKAKNSERSSLERSEKQGDHQQIVHVDKYDAIDLISSDSSEEFEIHINVRKNSD